MNHLAIASSHLRITCVATYPSAGGRCEAHGYVFHGRKNARSRHQRLFEENVGKTGKMWSTNFKRERFGSYFFARGRY